MGTWLPGPGPTDGNDVFFGEDADDIVNGGLGNDTLNGYNGNDNLTGGDGSDTLRGGGGDDTLHGDDGIDELTGGDGNDLMFGGAGNDWFIAGSTSGVNNDTFNGGAGDDDFIFSVTDVVGISGVFTIDGGDGFDVLQSVHQSSYVTFNAGSTISNVEALHLRGQFNLDFSLMASIPTIWGNGGALIMRGPEVWDLSQISFPSAFTYNSNIGITSSVTNASLSVIGSSGNDTITLPSTAGARIFIFGGQGNDTLTGSGANDIMAGDQGNDVVHGGDGNDEIGLFGGGVDMIFGDAGDDTFYFRADNYPNYVPVPANTPLVATVSGGEGNDTLIITEGVIGAGTSFTSIETTIINYVTQGPITMAPGTLPTTGTLICADARLVHSSDGTTDFSAMNIPMADGRRMIFTGSAGNDFFIWAAASEVKVLASGGEGNDVLRGGAGSDELTGGNGDDTLDGGAGADTMTGGDGNDTYVVDNVGDVVVEGIIGVDTVRAAVDYALINNVENLTLIGTAIIGNGNAVGNVITGNAGANTLSGFGGADTLVGGDGDDYLDGGIGADAMTGGSGNDTYVVDSLSDVVTELAANGIDTVRSSVSITLAPNVENLVLLLGASQGTGNALDNALTGNAGATALYGLEGNDTLDGGAGGDEMWGGLGDDTYYVDDQFDLVRENSGEGLDTVYASVSFSLADNVENLTLVGGDLNGTGNGEDNTIIGTAGANTLDGGAGADVLRGGAGNDIYVVDGFSDIVAELGNEGTDLVQTFVTYQIGANIENLALIGAGAITGYGNVLNNTITGNSAANTLFGFDGNDILDGGAGVDQMFGGLGDDSYYVDNAGDVTSEASALGGTDIVYSSVNRQLTANIENLTLTGTAAIGYGNIINNTVVGNASANTLYGFEGDDRLDGGAGVDTMFGAAGNDTYVVDNINDVTVEGVAGAGGGTDTIESSVDRGLNANIENLTLTGTAAIGYGNVLDNLILGNASANQIFGFDGNDTLDGGAGADQMYGGNGNDTYYVDNSSDVTSEASAAGGIDFVISLVSRTLTANIENLSLAGSGNNTGAGNVLDNVIIGNTGNNTLYGLDGNDTLNGAAGADILQGGAGADRYAFTSSLSAGNVDTILGYNVADDTIVLNNNVFTGLAAGTLAASAFVIGAAAVDADDRIIYNSSTGALYFDVDGVGGAAAVQFATLSTGLALTNNDFIIDPGS